MTTRSNTGGVRQARVADLPAGQGGMVRKDKRAGTNWEGMYFLSRDDPAVEGAGWVPPVDIYETDEAFMLNAELPGVNRNDVSIEVKGSELCIRGERYFDSVCSQESYSCLEGIRGHFVRRFTLPEQVDSGQIKSVLKDGVLHVTIPKSVARPPKLSAGRD